MRSRLGDVDKSQHPRRQHLSFGGILGSLSSRLLAPVDPGDPDPPPPPPNPGTGLDTRTPTDYGSDLLAFWSAESGLGRSGSNVTTWRDQEGNTNLTRPSDDEFPVFVSNAANGLPGVNFEEASPSNIDRKLISFNNRYDNIFNGSGNKTIGFAARLNRLVDTTFGQRSVLISKGFPNLLGWEISVLNNGSIRFQRQRTSLPNFQIIVPGFYSSSSRRLVLGTLTYNGGNSSSSGQFRLWDGNQFVDRGSITTGGSSTVNDASAPLTMGNVESTTQTTSGQRNNAPWQGPIMAVWITRPGASEFDDAYLMRWV